METISGVDGCSWGWLALTKELVTGKITWAVHTSTGDLFARHQEEEIIAIDIPIGLAERGARICDLKARQLLGAQGGGTIFAAPTRAELSDGGPDDAIEPREPGSAGKRSWHALRLLMRVMQVDAVLRKMPALRAKVHEIHPEVSFFLLGGGRPMRHNKKTEEGSVERANLLGTVFGRAIEDVLAARFYVQVGVDDVLDAFAALWTAERIHKKEHLTLPPAPPLDAAGLPMEIVA